MSEKRKKILEARRKILLDQLKIMDLFPEDTIEYFGSQREIERRIDELLDEIIEIDKLFKAK